MVRRGAGRAARKDRARRLKRRLSVGWTADKVRALSNEVILERLAGFGIATSASEVVELAHAEYAASAIGEAWRQRFEVSVGGFHADFIDLAAGVLWERLLPERPSFEMLDERMQAGYVEFWSKHDAVRACDRWLEVWNGFKLHFAPEMTRVRDVDAIFH